MLLPDKERKLCPNIAAPFEGCYCNEMTSQDVEKAIYYCANNYNLCDIYLENRTDSLHSSAEEITDGEEYTGTIS